jgi:hypothetical protein
MLTATQAQRVDLDRFNFTVSYRDFPEEPLPSEYKTFNLRIEVAPSLGYLNLGDGFTIDGLKRVNGTGHITILAILDDILIEKSELKERLDVKKDRQGNETRRIYYANEIVYSFSARASVYDYKGNTILSNYILSDREKKQTYRTSEFSSPAEASNFFNSKIFEIKNNLAKQLSAQAISNLNTEFNYKYGYQLHRTNDILWILNNKRHAAYADHQAAWNQFKNAIVLMSADESLDKVKEKMKPVIAYFEKAKTQYTGSDKEARKMRYASFYNLAKIYLWLDEPDKAKIEADELAMNDYDESDGKNLRAMAENLETTLRKNNSNSRHFAVNVDSYQSPVR